MSDRVKVLPDIIPNIGFNLESQETFATDHGILIEHWAAIPSTIGKKDRGDLRRPDALDTISENGYIYKKVGEFVGTILGNSLSNNHVEAGIQDHSTARLMMPKLYQTSCDPKHKEISLLPGDRLYAKQIELRVPNYQEVEYRPRSSDTLQFPAKCVMMLQDSQGIDYTEGVEFMVTDQGDIKWLDGKPNPGIDPDTGKGRLYGIRYMYIAFWYVQQLLNEIRITNESDSSTPARLPYHAMIQREYVYHNKNRGDKKDSNIINETPRTQDEPTEVLDPNEFEIKVDVGDYEE